MNGGEGKTPAAWLSFAHFPSVLAKPLAFLAREHSLRLCQPIDDAPGKRAARETGPQVVFTEAGCIEPGKPVAAIA